MAKFSKGKSGNPGGRPKDTAQIGELARKHSRSAIARLVQWMESENPKASVSACMALLDRGYGKPQQSIEHKGEEFFSGFAEKMAEARKRAQDRAWLDDPPSVN